MTEYRITWQQCPHIHHPQKVLFVEAGNAEDARKIAKDHIERRFAIEWFTIHTVDETTPLPEGRVKEAR